MARAQGARALMALAFETTYGTPPASGFTRMPFASTSLGAEQPLLNSELLGYGRDPLAPIKDAVTADGDVVVPLDAEAFGFWLKAAFGAPVTSGTTPKTHTFQSGNWTLPSMAIETAMPEVQVEVPLAEDLESYDVQILDGAVVKRTLSSSTTSVLYTAAQQTADWGAPLGPGQTLAILISKLSNRLGRGDPAAVTLQF